MKKLFYSSMVVALLVTLTGCAVGRKMSYENMEVKPDYKISKSILSVFQDKRAEVLAGTEKPSWCGHMNSTTQIPYNMQTESGKPLADEFSTSFAGSLIRQGVNAIAMIVNMNSTSDSILQVFTAGKLDRLVMFTINKWESSASPRFSDIHYEVIYNLDLKVYDRNGKQLAGSNVHDNVVRNQDMAVNVKRLQAMADEVFISQVRLLMNNESVKAALQ